jgi:nucleoside-diphosphate-sugar epimerase
MGLKKEILITGGLGNLGSWLTHYFCDSGYHVTVLTKRKRELEFEDQFEMIMCDISDERQCEKALKKQYDIIIHVASVNDHFVNNYEQKALNVNAWGTRNVLEAIKDHPPKNFIYLSTFHIYGKKSGRISEKTIPKPLNDYGMSHLFAEYYLKQYQAIFDIPYTIIRLSNSYGCPKDYDSSKWYLILNDLSQMAYENQIIKLKGNGQATRDFIWMGDVCSIFEKIASAKATNETYNLSSGKAFSLLDVAKAVQSAYSDYYGKTLEIEVNTDDKTEAGKPLKIDSSKLKQSFPYQAKNHFKNEAEKIFKFLEARKN